MWRRSKRSATWPMTNTSSSSGANWAEPHKPERERTAREVVHLPADRNADHLPRHRRARARAAVVQKRPVAKRLFVFDQVAGFLGTDRARRVPDDAIAGRHIADQRRFRPVEAPSPIVTGATSELFEPMNTSRRSS